MSQEKAISVADKLYKSRHTVKLLYGEKWKEIISFHTDLINAVMKKHNMDNELEAVVFIVNNSNDDKTTVAFGLFTMKLMVAAVEIIEPL
jgi:hypothetical protein